MRLPELDSNVGRQSIPATFMLERKMQNCVLMVELAQFEAVDVMESQRNESVGTCVLGTTLGGLQNLNLRVQDRPNPTIPFRTNIAAPEIDRVHLGVMKRRPLAEQVGQESAVFDEP